MASLKRNLIFGPEVIPGLSVAVMMAFVIPILGYQIHKNSIPKFEALAIAASFGSVSAVTFVTAMQFLENNGLSFGGHMTVAMVRMESTHINF